MTSSVDIGIAQPGQARAVAELIAGSFNRLAVAEWLVGDPEERLAAMAGQFEMLVEHAVKHGHVYIVDDLAAAVWFDRTIDMPEPADYTERLRDICGTHLARFETLDEAFETHHPGHPHHHLAFLAVKPGRQGTGLGTALLEHHHSILDAAGIPAYLEASSPRNRQLYQRHGYNPHVSTIQLPDGPSMWPMWRDAVNVG